MREDKHRLRHSIAKARELIFIKGVGVTGKWIQDLLGASSQLPNQASMESLTRVLVLT
jgi:hypothetical protein